jgi:hypothetical protein
MEWLGNDIEERSLWYCSSIHLERLKATIKLSVRISRVLLESETRYVQNLYQHTQPDKQDSIVTGVKKWHITIQPLYYSFYMLPHPNGIKKKEQGTWQITKIMILFSVTSICSKSATHNTSFYQFIPSYIFWLQMWAIIRPCINV